jgi:membrane associated rhomboid family serine protease
MSYQANPGFSSFGLGLRPTPMVKRLLIANVVVFGVQKVVESAVGPGFMIDWFAFQPRQLVFRPWGPITYMFLHGDLMHLFGNMLFLFFFGPPLEARWGEREFLKYFVVCGLGGVALSFVFMPASIVGASAAVYGVMLAFAMNWPNAPIYVFGIFPVLAKYLVAFFGVVALLGATGSAQGSNVAHFAHLGGLITGWLWLKADFRKGNLFEGVQRAARRKRRLAIVPGEEANERESSGRASRRRKPREDKALYDRVDAVLDKISAEGMSSLTPAELELLDQVSKKHRTN